MTRTPVGASAVGGVRSREVFTRADRIKIALLVGSLSLAAATLGAVILASTALSGQILEWQQTLGG